MQELREPKRYMNESHTHTTNTHTHTHTHAHAPCISTTYPTCQTGPPARTAPRTESVRRDLVCVAILRLLLRHAIMKYILKLPTDAGKALNTKRTMLCTDYISKNHKMGFRRSQDCISSLGHDCGLLCCRVQGDATDQFVPQSSLGSSSVEYCTRLREIEYFPRAWCA